MKQEHGKKNSEVSPKEKQLLRGIDEILHELESPNLSISYAQELKEVLGDLSILLFIEQCQRDVDISKTFPRFCLEYPNHKDIPKVENAIKEQIAKREKKAREEELLRKEAQLAHERHLARLAQLETAKNKIIQSLEKISKEYKQFKIIYHEVCQCEKGVLKLAQSEDGKTISVTEEERLKHTYILGSTGSGKSSHLFNMVIQDLINGVGGCLIDPYGALFKELFAFSRYYEDVREKFKQLHVLAQEFLNLNERNFEELDHDYKFLPVPLQEDFLIISKIPQSDVDTILPILNCKFVDLEDSSNTQKSPNPYRINPFEMEEGEDLHDITDSLIRSVERTTGQSSDETPLLATVLEAIFSYNIYSKSEIKELLPFITKLLNSHKKKLQGELLQGEIFRKLNESINPTAKQAVWSLEYLLGQYQNEFVRSLASTANRMKLFNNPVNFNLLSTKKSTLHLYDEINGTDEQGRRPFLLFNIPAHDKKSAMAGAYLLTRIDKIIRKRNTEQKKLPYFVYIDEFHNFVDMNLSMNFTATRQYGLAFIVSHQSTAQLKENDHDNIKRDLVSGQSGIRLFFNCDYDDASFFVKQNCKLTGKREKYVTFSESESKSKSEGTSQSIAQSGSTNESETNSFSKGTSETKTSGESETTGTSSAKGRHDSQGNSSSTTDTQSNATTSSESQSQQKTVSNQTSYSHGRSENWSDSISSTTGMSENRGYSSSNSMGENTKYRDGVSTGMKDSVKTGSSQSYSSGQSISRQEGTSSSSGGSTSESETTGRSEGYSDGTSQTQGQTETIGHSRGKSHSSTKGNSYTDTESKSKTKSSSVSKGSSEEEGESYGRGRTYGQTFTGSLSENISKGQSFTRQYGYYSLEEEERLLTQEVQELDKRELFVSFRGLKTIRGKTTDCLIKNDSLTPHISKYMGDKYFHYLTQSQQKDREHMISLVGGTPIKTDDTNHTDNLDDTDDPNNPWNDTYLRNLSSPRKS